MVNILWNPEIRIGDILTIIGFAFTIASLIFAAHEIRRNTLSQRTRFLLDFTERYFSDNDVRKFFYMIDYNHFIFDRNNLDNFKCSDEERWLDSLLYTFDIIGRMVRTGAVTLDEVSIIGFQALRVLENDNVEYYLDWLDDQYKLVGRKGPAHKDARYLKDAILASPQMWVKLAS